MSRETKLFINFISHSLAVTFSLYLGYKHIDQPDTLTWCLTAVAWIGIAGYRNDQLIKTRHDFNQVIQEAMETALEIKETVNTIKASKIKKPAVHDTF